MFGRETISLGIGPHSSSIVPLRISYCSLSCKLFTFVIFIVIRSMYFNFCVTHRNVPFDLLMCDAVFPNVSQEFPTYAEVNTTVDIYPVNLVY